MLALILLILIFVLLLFLFVSQQKRSAMRDRVNFGFHEEVEDEEPDLSAGDYGLSGQQRFFYNLEQYLGTTQGSILIVMIGAFASGVISLLYQKPINTIITTSLGGGALLFVVSMLMLFNHRKQRDNAIKVELPNALQTISAIMEGGLAFETATTHVVRESDSTHPLYFELGVMLEAMQRGRRRNEALKLWEQRSNVSAVTDVVAGLVQADQTGASLGSVLHHHGQTLLKENEAEIQRRAERLPVKMLFPMAFMILPAVMIIAAGPSMVRIFQIISDITSRG